MVYLAMIDTSFGTPIFYYNLNRRKWLFVVVLCTLKPKTSFLFLGQRLVTKMSGMYLVLLSILYCLTAIRGMAVPEQYNREGLLPKTILRFDTPYGESDKLERLYKTLLEKQRVQPHAYTSRQRVGVKFGLGYNDGNEQILLDWYHAHVKRAHQGLGR